MGSSERATGADEPALKQCAEIYKAFASPKRLRILDLLREGECCVTEICEETGFPQPTVSSHLRKLWTSGVVAAREDGVQTYYRVADDRIIGAIDTIRETTLDDGERPNAGSNGNDG